MTMMKDILKMVREGRLSEATTEIQNRLSGREADTTSQPAPMRDITPTARAIPSETANRRPAKGKVTRPKRHQSDPGMSHQTGAVPYRLFTPSAPRSDAPLIVMLHGCTQTPEDFAAGTGMNASANAVGAYVIWPEQTRAANANGCWNWFETQHQGRAGEAAAIVSVVGDVLSQIGGLRSVHVAGLSAGGAMAAILGAYYPDVFASVGVHSGLPVGSARDVMSAFGAMRSGGEAAVPLKVPAIVFHGTADSTVVAANGTTFLPPNLSETDRVVVTTGGRQATVSRIGRTGETQATELWEIDGLGHAWSGGHHSGSYADPVGPDATAEMMRFFADVDKAG